MKFISEFFILALMIASAARVFMKKKASVDTLVVLSPVAFFASLLHFFAFGVDFYSIVLPIFSFIVLISNFTALVQFSSGLIVYRYSHLMNVWSAITILLSTAALVIVIFFRPVELKSIRLGITEKRTALSGNFNGGFWEAETFAVADAQLFEFAPDNYSKEKLREAKIKARQNEISPTDDIVSETPPKPIVVFVADKRGDTQNYKPYLQFLAQSGYTCYSADFFAKDVRWFHTFEDKKMFRRIAFVIQSLTDNQKFMSHREFYTYNFSKEFVAMIDFLDGKNAHIDNNFGTDAGGYGTASLLDNNSDENSENVAGQEILVDGNVENANKQTALTSDDAENNSEQVALVDENNENAAEQEASTNEIAENETDQTQSNGTVKANERKYFFVTDELGFEAACDIQKKNSEKVIGVFDISKVDSYKTAGYGFVEQTDPLLARFLGLGRDGACTAPKEAAEKTKEAIEMAGEIF